ALQTLDPSRERRAQGQTAPCARTLMKMHPRSLFSTLFTIFKDPRRFQSNALPLPGSHHERTF
ncbi:hypothetical protein, partial [Azospirillum brasilense]|uniref:hypothetical protein n=1 Tax=Azospirillum brasilense TaxID=192 RepID=UPI001B3B6770